MAAPERKDYICHYRQQAHRKPSKPSSEHQHGKRKRWYEQLFSPNDPQAASIPKNKMGWASKKVRKAKCRGPRLARPGECPNVL